MSDAQTIIEELIKITNDFIRGDIELLDFNQVSKQLWQTARENDGLLELVKTGMYIYFDSLKESAISN